MHLPRPMMSALAAALFVSSACADAGDGDGATDGDPTCFVDFPCGMLGWEAACTASGDDIQTFRSYACHEVCGDEPCSGGGCAAEDPTPCPDGQVCVEPEQRHAECRPLAATCGGVPARPCGAGEVCVRRATGDGAALVCEIVTGDLAGACVPRGEDVLQPCSDTGEPLPVDDARCGPWCAEKVCESGQVAACVGECGRRIRAGGSLCAACLLDHAPADDCGGGGAVDGVPDFEVAACTRACTTPLGEPLITVAADDERCVALCDVASCSPAQAAACVDDCAARIGGVSALCALCLVQTAGAPRCADGEDGRAAFASAGCEEVCFMDLGVPYVTGGGPAGRCDGLCERTMCPPFDAKDCEPDCARRVDVMSTPCGNCLIDHATAAACEPGASGRAVFDYQPCVAVCTSDVRDVASGGEPTGDPRCGSACEAAVCADRQGRCREDCERRLMAVGAACATCTVGSLEGLPDCDWQWRADACDAACVELP